jgi:S1-C subfamily serine protease
MLNFRILMHLALMVSIAIYNDVSYSLQPESPALLKNSEAKKPAKIEKQDKLDNVKKQKDKNALNVQIEKKQDAIKEKKSNTEKQKTVPKNTTAAKLVKTVPALETSKVLTKSQIAIIQNTYLLSNEKDVSVYMDAVVEIIAFFPSLSSSFISPSSDRRTSLGSGFFISPDGYIVTNAHVVTVEGCLAPKKITVKMQNGAVLEADLIGVDVRADIAVLKVKGRNKNFKYLKFAQNIDSEDNSVNLKRPANIKLSSECILIGSPFGMGSSIVRGGIVGIRPVALGIDRSAHYCIQTDAKAAPGFSGGPMLNKHGEVIGVNFCMLSAPMYAVAYSFAVIGDIASHISRQIIKQGNASRSSIGVECGDIDDPMKYAFDVQHGVIITKVSSFSPLADHLNVGDVIVSLRYGPGFSNLVKIRNQDVFARLMLNMKPGTAFFIQIKRLHSDNKKLNPENKDNVMSIKLHASTVSDSENSQASYVSVCSLLLRDCGYAQSPMVCLLAPDAPIGGGYSQIASYLDKGIILKVVNVNNKPISSIQEAYKELQKAEGSGCVIVTFASPSGSCITVKLK